MIARSYRDWPRLAPFKVIARAFAVRADQPVSKGGAQTRRLAGFSRNRLTSCRKRPPTMPSIMRWSHDTVTIMVLLIARSTVADHRAILDRAHRENRPLWRNDYGGEMLDSRHPHVGNRERRARQFIGGEAAARGLAYEAMSLACDLGERQFLRIRGSPADQPVLDATAMPMLMFG